MKAKKILSLLVSFIMLALTVLPCCAETRVCTCGCDPVVIVNGMGVFPFVVDAGTKNEHQVFPPETDKIITLAASVIPTAVPGVLSDDWSAFEKVGIPLIKNMFEEFACNPDGTSKYNVSTKTFSDSMDLYPDELGSTAEMGLAGSGVEKLPAGHCYDYNYDWRISPLTNAENLRKVIEYAKEKSGHDKVKIICASMGGIQTMGYIYKYGTEDISSITFASSTFVGVYIVGDVLTKNVEIDFDRLVAFLVNLGLDVDESVLSNILAAAGVKMTLNDIIDSVMKNEKDNLYRDVLIPVFGYMGGVWALCQDDCYEEAKTAMLADADPEFIDLIDEFHYNVLCKAEELLYDVQASGTDIYVFSHYDTPAIPLYKRANANSDGTLEAECTGGLANIAPYGKTLPENYEPLCTKCSDAGHDHISPDRVVDASCCLFPETTWFIKDMNHVGIIRGSYYEDLIWKILTTDEKIDIYSYKEYPQFLDAEFLNSPMKNTDTVCDYDIDGNGTVDTDDVRTILEAAVGIADLTELQLEKIGRPDNRSVTAEDARNALTEMSGIAS